MGHWNSILNPFRASRTGNQLPQANLANCGNWLTPKRKALRSKRCLKAGDGSASQTRVSCLTLTLPIRGRRGTTLSPYAIGIRCRSATLIGIRFCGGQPTGKPNRSNPTRSHWPTPRIIQKCIELKKQILVRREGQKGLPTANLIQSQTPNRDASRVHNLRSPGKPSCRRSSD